MTTSVLATSSEYVDLATRLLGPLRVLSSHVAEGRAYVLVAGDVGSAASAFVDPIDGTLLLESHVFASVPLAQEWIDAEIARCRRPM